MGILVFIFKELDTYNMEIFYKIHEYLFNHCLFYYESLESYLNKREPTVNQKLLYYTNLLSALVFTIRYGLLTINSDQSFQIAFGEMSFVFIDKYRYANAFGFAIGLAITIVKLAMFYYDNSPNNHYYKIIHGMASQSSFYKLSVEHESKLILRSNLIYWFYVKFCSLCAFNTSLLYLLIVLLVYIFSDHSFNLFTLIITSIIFIITFNSIKSGALGGIALVFMVLSVMRWKLDEIIKSFRVSIRWRNKVRLLNDLNNYDQFTRLIEESNFIMSMVIGIVYIISPYLASLVFDVWQASSFKHILNFQFTLGVSLNFYDAGVVYIN